MSRKKPKAIRGSIHAPPTNAFPPGNPGGPGRPKDDPEFIAACRERTPKSLEVLDRVQQAFLDNEMTAKGDPLIPAAAAVKASEVLLNRAWGTAPATIKLDATVDVHAQHNHQHEAKPIEVDLPRFVRIAQVLQRAGVLELLSGASDEAVDVQVIDAVTDKE